jgi:hypothetical protein
VRLGPKKKQPRTNPKRKIQWSTTKREKTIKSKPKKEKCSD